METQLLAYAERRAPRYTSYPTANQFSEQVDANMAQKWLGDLDRSTPLSLYLHVPFCRKVCWYCACNMKLAIREAPVLEYADVLRDEVKLVADALPSKMSVQHIHWGGGTPTAMPEQSLKMIMGELRERFDLTDELDMAFEIDPRTFETGMAKALACLGTNRVSLGVQEFDRSVQEAVNRVQPFETVKRVVEELRDVGIDQINFDLMYGLPLQSVETITKTIGSALTLKPNRIALFGYAHVPWMAKRQKMLPEDKLPSVSERHEQAQVAAKLLTSAGYLRIGLDHFALPDDPLAHAAQERRLVRNFQGYSDDPASTLIGLGSTSISSMSQGYYQNTSAVGLWAKAISSGKLPVHRGVKVTAEDEFRRDIVNDLMCYLDVDLAEITGRRGASTASLDEGMRRIGEYVRTDLVKVDGYRLSITERGRPFVRLVAAAFDTRLIQKPHLRHAVAV